MSLILKNGKEEERKKKKKNIRSGYAIGRRCLYHDRTLHFFSCFALLPRSPLSPLSLVQMIYCREYMLPFQKHSNTHKSEFIN